MESDSASGSDVQRYHGLDQDVQEKIKGIVRTMSRDQYGEVGILSDEDGSPSSGADERISIFSSRFQGVNPVFSGPDAPDYDARLDPNSDKFSSTAWLKNTAALVKGDPEYYKHYTMGCCWKNLRAYGDPTDVAYQTTTVNAPMKMLSSLKRKILPDKEQKVFDILKPMDGLLKAGELLVVLGRPGSGCSTLLKSISSNSDGYTIDPSSIISYNGMDPKTIKKHFRGEVVYNAESDVHFPHLSVYETLYNIALLATPSNRIKGLTREEFANHVAEVVMATYGLSHARDTKVGNELVRGVSGGERKRVSIAEVSICGSRFQCWDNATRGLDSATALEFIRALKTNTDITGSSGVIAIYQCSQDAYDLFDKTCVLYEGYQIYYGSAKGAKQYFKNMGYLCPSRQTTADFLTAVTNPAERIVNEEFVKAGKFIPATAKEMEVYWRSSPEYKQLIDEIDAELTSSSQSDARQELLEAHVARQAKRQRKGSPYLVNYGMQVKYLTARNLIRLRKSYGITLTAIVGNIGMSLVLGSIFYKSMKDTTTNTFFYRGAAMFTSLLFNSFSSLLEINSLFEARPITEKHKRYSLYHPSAEAFASMFSEFPAKLIVAICFNLIIYFMVNFRREPGPFFFYLMMNFLATLAMSAIFRCLGSATKTISEAMVPASCILLAISLYVGFSIPKRSLLGWSEWIWYINPLSYIFEALMINEFKGRHFPCGQYIPNGPGYENISDFERVCSTVGAVPGLPYVSGSSFIHEAYGFNDSHKWRALGIILAYAIFFTALYLLLCEYNESAVKKGEILLFPKSILKKAQKNQLSKGKRDLESGDDPEAKITDQKLLQDSADESNLSSELEKSMNVGLSKSKAVFHWRNVSYDVKVKNDSLHILSNVDGWVKPGTLTALMGSSGAGKTTLLDCLASRVTTGIITGDMFVNGHLRDSSFPRSIGYCQQQDLHLPTATVRESLRFSAYLRQPSSVSINEKNSYVEDVIKVLEMEKYADAIVGVAGEGLNVEQRKRLTIGVELAAKPKLLLFLDEPTSGLDSQTAWSICQLMRKLADHGQAILCTIHQPSALLMQSFDRLLFLQKGGKTVYFGDLGTDCQTMVDYFENHGAHPCPTGANPAEWMLEVIGAAPGSHALLDYHEAWRNSDEYKAVQKELDRLEVELREQPLDNTSERSEFSTSLWYQFMIVTHRLFQQYYRTPSYIWSKLLLTVFSQVFIGFTFFKSHLSLQGLQNQMFAIFTFTIIFNPACQQYLPLFVSQRDLYEARERPSRTFSWIAFILSQFVVEIPFNILFGTLSFFEFYYPIGFYNNASYSDQLHERGVLFWLFCVVFYLFISSTAQLCIAAVEHAEEAGNIGSLLFTMSLLFCGVFGGPGVLPGFWIFMYRVSPLAYFIDGVLSTGLANNPVTCADYEYVNFQPASGQTCEQYMSSYISQSGGYLQNPNATENCSFCKIENTNKFLASVQSSYSRRWRNLGIFIAFLFINWIGCILLYWLARVPKKKNRVANEYDPDNDQKKWCKKKSSSQIEQDSSNTLPTKET